MGLPPDLVRAANGWVEASSAYDSLSELVRVALANQLELERHSGPPGAAAPAPTQPDLLALPDGEDPLLVEPQQLAFEPLFVLTNRLLPLKLACRVLANLQLDEEPVSVPRFQRAAAAAARTLGLQLRREDQAAGVKGAARRWVALPVGTEEHAAAQRFAQFFALDVTGSGAPSGPLPQLSLAFPQGRERCALTDLGWRLARAPSPVLGEAVADSVLSPEECEAFIQALRSNPAEHAAVLEFIEIVESFAGRQADVDAALQRNHEGWNRERATAHRAAMLGRLRDLGLATVEGRGPTGRIRLEEDIVSLGVSPGEEDN